jgi:HD-GYP domain-containing protein (c-di-GMP phosphodiesterase class II)
VQRFFRQHQVFLALIAAQAISLAAGMWAHQKFLQAHATWSAEQAGADFGPPDGGPPTVPNPAERFLIHGLALIWMVGIQGVIAWLVLIRLRGAQERKQLQSDEQTLIKTRELVRTRDAIVFGLAKLAESRDADTGMHLERIALYSTRLATALRRNRKYRDVATGTFINTIGISSALHDIGKVGVEDSILLKPGRLTREEYSRIQVHTRLGGECIQQIERRLGNSNFLEMARVIALHHHERWDGSGYPSGLRGEDIPLPARIVAIADVYDALRSERVYKAPKPHDECVEIIRGEAGRQFDPVLVEVFLQIHCQFQEIADRFVEAAPPTTRRTWIEGALTMSPDEERLLTRTLEGETAPTGPSLYQPSAAESA